MTNQPETAHIEKIRVLYEQAYIYIRQTSRVPEIEVRFYPYINTLYRILRRGGKIYVKLADLHNEMPLEIHEALAYLLIAKLYGKRPPANALRAYSQYKTSAGTRERVTANRIKRGRKVISGSAGSAYDLEEIFDRINLDYFNGSIPKVILTWSARKTYHRLGHYDSDHNTIVISRSLDDSKVPKYVVESVMHHEMLHVYHPAQYVNGRRRSHTPAFRRDEEKFADFDRAEDWIRDNARNLRIRAKSSHRPR